jgi:hypothetical protein
MRLTRALLTSEVYSSRDNGERYAEDGPARGRFLYPDVACSVGQALRKRLCRADPHS